MELKPLFTRLNEYLPLIAMLILVFAIAAFPEIADAQVLQKLENATKQEVLGGTWGQTFVAAAFVFLGLMFLTRRIDLGWMGSIIVGAFFIAGAVYLAGILFGYFS